MKRMPNITGQAWPSWLVAAVDSVSGIETGAGIVMTEALGVLDVAA